MQVETLKRVEFNMDDVNPFLVERVKSAFEKIMAAPNFSVCEGVCLYRGPNDTKCVIGHMIDDENYSEDIEKHRIKNSIVFNAFNKSNPDINVIYDEDKLTVYQDSDFKFLDYAQRYHDEICAYHDEPAQSNFSFDDFLASKWIKR